jgi:hypothetical protein
MSLEDIVFLVLLIPIVLVFGEGTKTSLMGPFYRGEGPNAKVVTAEIQGASKVYPNNIRPIRAFLASVSPFECS